MHIRRVEIDDADVLWAIMQPIILEGESYAFAAETSRTEALEYWLNTAHHAYVAEDNDGVVGSYIIRDNQPGRGSHIANASYMVHADARGKGIGYSMGAHSLEQARVLGYQAMQFNLVVANNHAATGLWQKLGFTIIGTVPKAFNHKMDGLTDAYIMHRLL